MSCLSCQRTKAIPTCTQNLTLGLITPDTEAIIYFENLATGRVDFTTATSDGDGLLIIDLSELFFAANQAYAVHVANIDAVSAETGIELTIGEESYDCVQIQFKRIHESAGGIKQYENITLETDA